MTIEIEHMMVGADVVTAGNEQLAIGFPEEVVKAWMLKGKSPTAWLVPDIRSHAGVAQWALEFPLYFALFVQGLFGKGEKLRVVLHQRDWHDVQTYLRLTLLGLTRDEMLAAEVAEPITEMLAAEAEYLALKRPGGQVAQIEDFLEPCFFDEESVAELGQLRIKAHGNNTYSFFAGDDRIEEYRLPLDTEQLPPYAEPLPCATAPMLAQPFEVVTLGTANGFSPTGPCSNVLVQLSGRFLLIDCGPYIRTLLHSAGVTLSQLQGLIITHAHEDHAVGLSALLELPHRVKLFITRENAAILRHKLAILNPQVTEPERLLDDAFDLVYVDTTEATDFYGLSMRFFYTMHSIPCTGVEMVMNDGGQTHRALFVGDNNSRQNIEKAAQEGVLSEERLQSLLSLYDWRGDLVIYDAGAGLIHGMPADFHQNPSTHVICVHTAKLPEEQTHLYTLARPGHRYTIVPQNTRPTSLERALGQKALVEAFGADLDWIDVLLDAAKPVSVNRDHVVVRLSDPDRDLFVILTGELAVYTEREGKPAKVATLHAGEIFGEMATITKNRRCASVIAETPARLLRIPAEIFCRFVRETRLGSSLPQLWQKRADLEQIDALGGASVTTLNRLARRTVRRTLEPGATLIREGSRSRTVFVLVKGRVQVYKGTDPLLVNGAPVTVEPGTLIGETAPFLEQARNASIVAVDECEVLAIRGDDFRRTVEMSPQLFRNISQMVKARSAAA